MNRVLEMMGGARRDVGQAVVRLLALILAALAAVVGLLFAQGAAAVLCGAMVALFLLTAAFPWGFGLVTGGALFLVAFVVALNNPDGSVGLNAWGMAQAFPLWLLGAVFARPDIITKAADIFRTSR